ncbi:MAG: hypothetical protein ABGW78_11490 [Pirellulales bacterium]
MTPTADSQPPNKSMLIVTVDRLPAWILPAWGSTWVATPILDELAASGVVFDRVLTPTPSPHSTVRDLLGEGQESLLERSVRDGLSVSIISDQPSIVETIKPPDQADVTLVEPACPDQRPVDESSTGVAKVCEVASKIIASDRPDVVWVNLGSLGVCWDAPKKVMDIYVDPEDPPPPEGCSVPNRRVESSEDPDLIVTLRHVFAAQVSLIDRCLGGLIQEFRLQQDGAEATLLVAGLRGIPLGLHGWIGGTGHESEDQLPFSETMHVPVLLVDSKKRMAGQRYSGLTIPADIGLTMRELGGWQAQPLASQQAKSLKGLFVDWQASSRDRVIIRSASGDAVSTTAWHYIKPHQGNSQTQHLLYSKPDDFFEQSDVTDRCKTVAEEFCAVLGHEEGTSALSAWTLPLTAATQKAPV